MSGWLYWTVFALVVALWIAVPLVHLWERRIERKDRELWEQLWR